MAGGTAPTSTLTVLTKWFILLSCSPPVKKSPARRLVKIYGESLEAKVEKRYSPAKYTGGKKEIITGNPGRLGGIKGKVTAVYAEKEGFSFLRLWYA